MKSTTRSKWLMAAGIYNLIWGAISIFIPEMQLHMMGIETTPMVLILWKCIGMIVGVYGLGYCIASIDPKQHWPIVFVGLLGKLFGVVGMTYYIFAGTVPFEFGLTCCLNDLIWIPAFYLILKEK